jgi:hypothetical protein
MKLGSTPNLDHQYQVVLADGLPDVSLTLFLATTTSEVNY